MPDNLWSAIHAAFVLAAVGAVGGAGAFLMTNEPLTARKLLAVLIMSGIFASGLFLIMHHLSPESWLLNIGMSVLSGIGGNTSIGIGMKVWQAIVEQSAGVKKQK